MFLLLASVRIGGKIFGAGMNIGKNLILLAASVSLNLSIRAESPNIILILTDDQGWSQRSGLMDPEVEDSGSDYLETPAMDRIANEGMRFTSG